MLPANVSFSDLLTVVETILINAPLHPSQASSLAKVLVRAERDNCKSHGIYRIEGALRSIQAGTISANAIPVVTSEASSAVVKVTANGGFANAAFDLALPELISATERHGIAAMVINDCAHLTALWAEVEALTDVGLAGLAMCPSYATVAPAGGTKPLLGTNPIAFGWPRQSGQPPYIFDFATSVAARGEIELHRRSGSKLPEGWALDRDGAPTVDPSEALLGAMLPFGGHKGSAIATMVELLAGVMIGDRTSPDVIDFLGTTTLAPVHGELIVSFSPSIFSEGRSGDVHARAETLFDAIMGQGARLPSQRRYAARATSDAVGIELTPEERASLDKLSSGAL